MECIICPPVFKLQVRKGAVMVWWVDVGQGGCGCLSSPKPPVAQKRAVASSFRDPINVY